MKPRNGMHAGDTARLGGGRFVDCPRDGASSVEMLATCTDASLRATAF